jgi:hypothetical protein
MYHYDGIKHYLFALGMDENIILCLDCAKKICNKGVTFWVFCLLVYQKTGLIMR